MCQLHAKENLQLKKCIAAMNYFDMSPEDYERFQPLLNKVLDDTVNLKLQKNPKMEAMLIA